jgi:hypothetical protein
MTDIRRQGRGPVRAGRAAIMVGAALALTACNLDVVTPDVVPPSSLAGASALPTLLAGASGDFSVAYTGVNNGNNGEGIILNSGLFADEFITADYFSTHVEIDARRVQTPNGSNNGVLQSLFRAVASANTTAQRFADAGKPNDSGRARALSLGGFVYTLVAETYCSGVPFSTVNADGSFNYGTPKSTTEMLAIAVAKFDSAVTIAGAASDAQQRALAQVGKGRALLDAGQYAAAAAAVASVPVSFNFSTEHSVIDPRAENGVYALTFVNSRYTTADNEGGNGLPWIASNDPRTPFASLGTSLYDGQTALFASTKYASYTAPVAIATGIEAGLIQAEATLKGGDYGGALTQLNALRATANLAPLAPAATPAAQEDQLFTERAYWLFGTAHRMGDLRRLVRQYGRDQAAVFPSGRYFKGAAYGTQVAFPVPQTEEGNPNFSRAACDPTKA